MKSVRVGIVAGEASGDILAANFMQSFRQLMAEADIDVEFEGVAGPLMQAQGINKLFDLEELSVMGLVEVLGRLPRLLSIRRQLVKYWRQNPPDVFIGVDAPDFNLTLEEKLKTSGIKTLHYVSPSIWAWRQKRVFKVKRAVDKVLVLLPFEKSFYDKYQVPCEFVGHTLADQISEKIDKKQVRQQLNLPADGQLIAVLPGSRKAEVELLAPDFIQACQRLAKQEPQRHFVCAAANERRKQQIKSILAAQSVDFKLTIIDGQARELMAAADAIMIASGTATLEGALSKTPMVACYRFKKLSYQIFKRLVKVKYFSLPNLITGHQTIPELLQDEVSPQAIAEHIEIALSGENSQQKADFEYIHTTLKQNAGLVAAQAVKKLIDAN
ncbi:lipid-A-disaccharide synthase [Gayadomonas joobiniege]|uniref:lipid-A-disaccharide synthase n=1 Tax=Gayadomonas joobiniege TaxID=1234606 RepID=UPI000372C8D7|nr:lipid-A-disaccharide synthase [Gayadomonas joobiniege]